MPVHCSSRRSRERINLLARSSLFFVFFSFFFLIFSQNKFERTICCDGGLFGSSRSPCDFIRRDERNETSSVFIDGWSSSTVEKSGEAFTYGLAIALPTAATAGCAPRLLVGFCAAASGWKTRERPEDEWLGAGACVVRRCKKRRRKTPQ